MTDEKLYTEHEAAAIIGISVTTLRKQRYRVQSGRAKRYVRWIKTDEGRVLYPAHAIQEYMRDEI